MKLVKTINKIFPYSAKYIGKIEDKPDTLRPMFQYINNQNKGFYPEHKPLVGVEVGIDIGINAKKIMDKMHITCLYLVDPYTCFDYQINGVTKTRTIKEQSKRKQIAKQYLKTYTDYEMVEWVIQTSRDASRYLKDKTFDFIYLDGLHDYSNVLADCYDWYPLVKSGGLLGGHDFIGSHKDLQSAVKDFSSDKQLKLNVHPPDWWVIKP